MALSRRSLALAALAVAAALVVPAHAATPYGGARYVVHDHRTAGANWHVEATVGKEARNIKSLVIYAEQCGGETTFAQGVPIGPDGEVSLQAPLDAEEPAKGSYSLEARFATPQTFEGSFTITKPGCTAGPIEFVARTGSDGHAGHDHGSGHGSHHAYGPPFGTMPDLSDATPRRRAQARRLWKGSLRTAARRFPTYRAARRQDYVRYMIKWNKPVIFHLRRHAYARDRRVLDTRRPESLVYYWPAEGKPILLGFMYRQLPGRKPPRLGRPLIAWHNHGDDAGAVKRSGYMAHVWLTGDLRSALANCLPVEQLEAAIPGFDYADVPTVGAVNESKPCPES